MTAMFDASVDTMRLTSTKVLNDAQSVQSDLQGLLSRLMALEGQWIGDGRVAFQAAEVKYEAATTKLHTALSAIGQLVADNGIRYASDDGQAHSGLSSSGAHFDAPGF